MARGRSTFSKRQKEQARQQRQRDKAERRKQRQQENPGSVADDDMSVLREHAAMQAALFHVGPAGSNSGEASDVDNTGSGQSNEAASDRETHSQRGQ